MATGIKDRVAIIGMGCTRFGERWDASLENLAQEAFSEALADAKLDVKDIQAVWFSVCMEEASVGKSSIGISTALRLPFIPVTRVENYCASGTEAFRGAVYAVASGAYDVAMAIGAEKLKDIGYGGLPGAGSGAGTLTWLWWPNVTAPGAFAQLASAYTARYGHEPLDVKRAMAQVSVKSHANGAKNEKAHLRKPVSMEQVMGAPIVAHPLGLFDCCGVSDGSACAIVTTVERAKAMGYKDFVTVKALEVGLSSGEEMQYSGWDGAHFETARRCSTRAYAEAGIKNPRKELSLLEVHDCFSITELVTYEDLHLSEPGHAVKDVLDGVYNLDGELPCQVDGGLKCFGHPIGASGLRMLYELYLQMHGRAGARQRENPRFGLTHNLGGFPFANVCSIAIVGRYGV
ncbi:MAG: acetyl-CoA acetyltransferase [Myxococcales bacterium]|nr:MAG: acetyl-CoA acetyltransferase [Myxococcales bacterium]